MPRYARWASAVPWCMRSWPWLRRYFWQQSEIDLAKQRAKELLERLAEDGR